MQAWLKSPRLMEMIPIRLRHRTLKALAPPGFTSRLHRFAASSATLRSCSQNPSASVLSFQTPPQHVVLSSFVKPTDCIFSVLGLLASAFARVQSGSAFHFNPLHCKCSEYRSLRGSLALQPIDSPPSCRRHYRRASKNKITPAFCRRSLR